MANQVNALEMFKKYLSASDDTKNLVFEEAQASLSKNQFSKFKAEVARMATALSAGDPTPASTETGNPEKSPPGEQKKEISPNELEEFWSEIDGMDPEEFMDDQVIRDFQYVGFNPDTILKTIITLGRSAGRNNTEIKTDIANMCTVAVIKGSITDNNLKKMSDSGKRVYSVLEERYKLKRGGSKNLDPSVVTIARVGAAFPGTMMKILVKKPDLAKKFSGSFGSKALPPYLRHQSAAACIPESLSESAKVFLLSLITAFTADQSKIISKSKEKPEDVYDKQENFISQTNSANYPTEAVRKEIFRTWTLDADYPKLKIVADNIAKVKSDFTVISQADLRSAALKV